MLVIRREAMWQFPGQSPSRRRNKRVYFEGKLRGKGDFFSGSLLQSMVSFRRELLDHEAAAVTVENPVAADPQRLQQILSRSQKNAETVLDATEKGYRGMFAGQTPV